MWQNCVLAAALCRGSGPLSLGRAGGRWNAIAIQPFIAYRSSPSPCEDIGCGRRAVAVPAPYITQMGGLAEGQGEFTWKEDTGLLTDAVTQSLRFKGLTTANIVKYSVLCLCIIVIVTQRSGG